jgi:hypothetical protein
MKAALTPSILEKPKRLAYSLRNADGLDNWRLSGRGLPK